MLPAITSYFMALYGDRKGVTAVEYGLIIALIAGALVLTLSNFATALEGAFTTVQAHF